MMEYFRYLLLIFIFACPVELRAEYSQEAVSYFLTTALGSEYGNKNPMIKKWNQNLRIVVKGNPKAEDLQTLRQVVGDLNSLVQPIQLQFSSDRPNVTIYFVPVSQFKSYLKEYVPGNMGFAYILWDGAYNIYEATVLISTEKITQLERNHLIREELTQSLGLLNDSFIYPDSIFYQKWTQVQTYAPIDRKVIQILYDPKIKPGMKRQKARKVLGY
ncbi:MAG: DUF2927 domain-containing protein [Deltaproteobacteria bacterium]|nr:DUF2927 domain-containing protein [Deltaproteobacteria bacterium]